MGFLKNKLAVLIIILSVGFLILIAYSVERDKLSFMENGVGVTINKVQGTVYSMSSKVKDYIEFVFSFNKIKKENEELKKKNDDLENKALDYDTLQSENARLRDMLNFKDQRSEYNYIGCNIIGKSGGNFLDGFAIDRGTKDGISKGMVVITSKGLVGQVTSTAANWSIIQTLSNENIAVHGMVESTNENGIIKGYTGSDNQFLAKLYNLPLDSSIKKGDTIVTSGLGGLYPKGIRIGYVIDTEDDKGKIMKNAIIQPYVDLNQLQEVFVVVPKDTKDIKY